MKKLICIIIIFSAAFFLMQCKTLKMSPAPRPKTMLDIAKNRWPSITQEELDSGKMIYATKCTQCHIAKSIANRSEAEWQTAINKMSPKAKLSQPEKEMLTHYIFTAREAGVN